MRALYTAPALGQGPGVDRTQLLEDAFCLLEGTGYQDNVLVVTERSQAQPSTRCSIDSRLSHFEEAASARQLALASVAPRLSRLAATLGISGQEFAAWLHQAGSDSLTYLGIGQAADGNPSSAPSDEQKGFGLRRYVEQDTLSEGRQEAFRPAVTNQNAGVNPKLPMDDNPVIAFLLTQLSARAAELSLPCSSGIPGLEAHRPGVLVGHYAVLMSGLGDDSSQADDWVRAAEQHVATALSWLPGEYREDLHLFLVGPPGACENLRWIELASQIERDERVCRKLVWLPPQSHMESSAQTFLDRTFLARPWLNLERIHQPRLDPVADVLRILSSRDELRDTPLSALHQWFEVLTQPGDSPDLVEPLMRALKEFKQ